MSNYRSNKKGFLLPGVIVFGFIGVVLLGGILNWAGTNIRSARHLAESEQAFQIAEAGIEYYRWHLAHDQDDWQDGTGLPGPYIHPYYDKEGVQVGNFELTITPPLVGTTIVTVASMGTTLANPNVKRIIEARLAVPSLAKFAVVADDNMRFGNGTEVFGPIHSNGGIRFDGLAHNTITSARTDYNDPDHSGGNEFGVHTHLSPTDPLPPAAVPARADVFEASRESPIPAIDFDGFTADLSTIKTGAQASGRYFAGSGALGYNIILKTNDTFDLYRVNTLVSPPTSSCYDTQNQDGWGTWSVNSQTLLGNYSFPADGLVFVEDNLWVEGQINGARLAIAAARFPENPATYANISFTKDILYTNYDGTDVLALMAQNNINAGMTSATTIRVDAALVAQKGRVGRYYYRPPGSSSRCSPYHNRDTITLYGMIATSKRYGFAYTDGNGYDVRNIIYDGNLLYGPPPSFPLTGDQYEIISWREIKD